MVRSYDKTKKATQEKLQGEACIQYAAAVNLPSHLLLPTTQFSSPHSGSTAADPSTRAPRYFGLMPEELGGSHSPTFMLFHWTTTITSSSPLFLGLLTLHKTFTTELTAWRAQSAESIDSVDSISMFYGN